MLQVICKFMLTELRNFITLNNVGAFEPNSGVYGTKNSQFLESTGKFTTLLMAIENESRQNGVVVQWHEQPTTVKWMHMIIWTKEHCRLGDWERIGRECSVVIGLKTCACVYRTSYDSRTFHPRNQSHFVLSESCRWPSVNGYAFD